MIEFQTIPEQLLFSTVRIETDKGVGTGFILQAKLNYGGSMIFLVTNKHVIADANTVSFFFTKAETKIITEDKKDGFYNRIKAFLVKPEGEPENVKDYPIIGEKVQVNLKDETWFNHPDKDVDLTLINLSPILNDLHERKIRVFLRSIPLDLTPSKEYLEQLDALENVIFIGYPSGIYDEKNLLPIIRTGMTATPIYTDYCGSSCFLIDASVFPGSSGSPVFIYDKSGYKDKKGNIYMGGERVIFCGVISKGFFRNDEGEIEFRNVPTKFQPILKKSEMIDLGIVIKSEKVRELLDLYLQDLNKKRREMYAKTNN